MEQDIELLSVQEFAEKAGVTTQWIYKQVRDKREINRYVIRVDGHIRINAEALSLYKTTSEQKQDGADSAESHLQELVQIMKEQLQVKDEQISQLQEMVKTEQSLRLSAERRILLLEQPEPEEQENVAPEPENVSEGKIERFDGGSAADLEAEKPRKGFFWRFRRG